MRASIKPVEISLDEYTEGKAPAGVQTHPPRPKGDRIPRTNFGEDIYFSFFLFFILINVLKVYFI